MIRSWRGGSLQTGHILDHRIQRECARFRVGPADMDVSQIQTGYTVRVNPGNLVLRHARRAKRRGCQIQFLTIQLAVGAVAQGQIQVAQVNVAHVPVLADNQNAVFRLRPDMVEADAVNVG